MRRLALVAGLLTVLCVAPLVVRAQVAQETQGMDGGGMGGHGMRGERHGGMHRGMRGHMRDRFANLDLTDTQKKKFADLRDAQQRKAIPLQADLKVAALDMRKLMRADRPDQSAINAQIDRMADLRASLSKLRVGSMIEMRSLLTDSQRAKLRDQRGGDRDGKDSKSSKSKVNKSSA